jgi:hypothetical protein
VTTTTVHPTAVTDYPDTRIVEIACPFCGRRHTHGWPHDSAEPGVRVAHCARGDGGTYRIGRPQ